MTDGGQMQGYTGYTNSPLKTDYPDNPAQKVRPVTEELDERRVRLAGHILRAANDDPLRQVTYQPDKLSPSVSENVELDPTFWHKKPSKTKQYSPKSQPPKHLSFGADDLGTGRMAKTNQLVRDIYNIL